MKLQNGFFNVKPFNPQPYFDPVIVDLSGSQKFEEDTIFKPGKYRIEIAPGLHSWAISRQGNTSATDSYAKTVYMSYDEEILTPFIVRAYCGSNATGDTNPGQNSYTGAFKVNGIDARTLNSSNRPDGIDVNHIFGAGGGNGHTYYSQSIPGTTIVFNEYFGGGCNCLGDGNVYIVVTGTSPFSRASGAGSCLHLLPVGGVFGTDYIRAYHTTPSGVSGHPGGGAYGGGATAVRSDGGWFTRGGNSPYGNGATSINTDGSGIGSGKTYYGSGAYFNGGEWIDVPATLNTITAGVLAPNSLIRITYLGPLV